VFYFDHTGLDLVVFGLGHITAFWSRSWSCTLWSWPGIIMFWSH